MYNRAYIFSIDAEQTTARYFQRAIDRTCSPKKSVYVSGRFDAQILTADDILLFVDPAPSWPLGLEAAPCVTAAYLIDVHRHLPSRIASSLFFDIAFVAQKDYVAAFLEAGHPCVRWLPLACDPEIHSQQRRERSYDVSFVGNIGEANTSRNSTLLSVLTKFRSNDFRRYHSPAEMGATYGSSKIVINASVGGDLNMRVFEAMASGAMLITDRIGNGLSDLFCENTHYVGYSSTTEAIDKIEYYLAHPNDRESIAHAGRRLALESHTYSNRWNTIEFEARLAFERSPSRSFSPRQLCDLYAEMCALMAQPDAMYQVSSRYGITMRSSYYWLRACARWLNLRVPITPNSIRASFARARRTRH